MKKEDAKKIAAIIACEMIGCNGDCDNCDKDDVERRLQEIINKLNDKAADVLKFAKSFKENTLAEQRELIFEKGKHFDVLKRVLAVHDVLELARDIELGSLKNLLDAFNIYRKLIKNWNDNINHIVEDDLKVLDNIYWDRFNAIEENKERTNTTVDLSGISKEDLEKELARRANK
jgi:hypothetical protein